MVSRNRPVICSQMFRAKHVSKACLTWILIKVHAILNEPIMCTTSVRLFYRLACINPPGPTHINSEYFCFSVLIQDCENCCPLIMEKRLSIQNVLKIHSTSILITGKDDGTLCFMAVDESLLSTAILSNWIHVVEWWIVPGNQRQFFFITLYMLGTSFVYKKLRSTCKLTQIWKWWTWGF